MITLNLAYPDNSDITFQKISYPDGQHDIRILQEVDGVKTKISFEDIKNDEVKIVSRFNTFIDLEFIIAANQSIKDLGCEDVHLYIPYLFSARADRKFVEGGNSYLKEITAPVLNSQNFITVNVVDVHNFKQARRRIHNFVNTSVLDRLVKTALFDLQGNTGKKCYLISPDKGAKPRTETVFRTLTGWNVEVVQCDKERDLSTSKIIRTIVPLEDFQGADCIILDDLVDGGRTFIENAELLKARNCGKIYLVLAHGIFSAGFDKLKTMIDKIYVTNSFKDIAETDYVSQLDVFDNDFVKSL